MLFKDILRYLREDKGVSQKTLADTCKISPTCICQLETGQRNPTGSTLIALADFFGYDPAGILCFDEGFEDDYDDDDDDNDFLQDLLDEDETESFIECWLNQLLEATGKPNVDELTAEEIRAEIDDIKGTISNEEIVLGISEFAEKNIEQYEAYLERLEEMLKNKEE